MSDVALDNDDICRLLGRTLLQAELERKRRAIAEARLAASEAEAPEEANQKP